MREFVLFLAFLAVLVLWTSARLARAQGLDGTLRGDVKDPGGGVVGGAKVTVTSEQTDQNRAQETTSGWFSFPNLLVGTYTISVEHEGFKKYVLKGVEIKANQVELRYVGTRGINLPAQNRLNAALVKSDNLFLPTFLLPARLSIERSFQ